ncbi:CLUMA_CG004463, isoform A [Clunio marinus]|uniref:DnaJ homolog subfamily C member 17 n=1 Tax=Clunio marinus TaxID=568069 RepID=A0A1J1HS15_9DIPT|nr:CLUMA_CG004463, isoform A [Clunio marinus]
MADFKKFSDIDLYKLIGVEFTATEAEIRKSYRKKALECHPDKNPDNPKAAELFHQLQDALAVLIDVSARSAYDRMLRAKKANELRNQQLDSKRQKLKSDLEAREREAAGKKTGYSGKSQTPEEIFKTELERIMRENKKFLEEENELLRQQIYKERHVFSSSSTTWDSSKHRIKIKWSTDKNDSLNGGYNHENLTKFLNKYGDIVVLLVSSKKKGSGVVEFKTQDAGEMAIAYEKGILENPLKLSWIGDAPKNRKSGTTVTSTDYESLVLRQMRQAEERKRIIEQMIKEDDE